MANSYTRYAENDPRAKGRGIPPDVLKKLMAGETVPGWTVNYNRQDVAGSGGGDGGGDSAGPSYGTTPVAFSYKDPSKEWYATYGPDGALMNEGNGKNSLTPQDLAKFAAAVGGVYGLNGGLAGLETAAGGADAATSAAWQGGHGLGLDTVGAVGGKTGSLANASSWLSAVPGEMSAELAAAAAGTPGGGVLLPGVETLGGTGLSAAANAGGAVKSAVGATTAPKDGWDTLAALGTSPAAKVIGGAVVSGLAANALTPDVDMSRFNQLFDNMLAEQQKTSARGDDLWASYQATWKPMQEAYAKKVMEFDSPWRREQAAKEASNTVASQYDTMRTSAERDMISAGLDPTTIQTLGASSLMQEAKDSAGAQNNARADIENRGMQYLGQAAQFGQQVPGMALNASGLATNQGTSALNAAATGQNQENQQTNNRNQMFGDIFGAGLKAAGMGLFDQAVKTLKPAGLGG